MASGYGKKNSIKEKFNAAVRKVVAMTALVGAAISPGWYYYGTVHEQDAKITSIEKIEIKQTSSGTTATPSAPSRSSYNSTPYNNSYSSFSSDSYYDDMDFYGDDDFSNSNPFFSYTPAPPKPGTYEYVIHTDAGIFKNKDTYTHLKFDSEDIEKRLEVGQTYHIKSYGVNIPFFWKVLEFRPNILKADLLTEKDIQVRAEAMKDDKMSDKAKADVLAQTAGQTTGASQTQVQQQQLLGGEVVTYPVVVGGYSVQLTVPVEGVGKVAVNAVRPVVPPAPGTP